MKHADTELIIHYNNWKLVEDVARKGSMLEPVFGL